MIHTLLRSPYGLFRNKVTIPERGQFPCIPVIMLSRHARSTALFYVPFSRSFIHFSTSAGSDASPVVPFVHGFQVLTQQIVAFQTAQPLYFPVRGPLARDVIAPFTYLPPFVFLCQLLSEHEVLPICASRPPFPLICDSPAWSRPNRNGKKCNRVDGTLPVICIQFGSIP